MFLVHLCYSGQSLYISMLAPLRIAPYMFRPLFFHALTVLPFTSCFMYFWLHRLLDLFTPSVMYFFFHVLIATCLSCSVCFSILSL